MSKKDQNTTKFSALVGGTLSANKGAVQKKAQALKMKQQMENDFKIGEIEASGKRSIRSIQGLRRDNEILYVGTYDGTNDDSGKRGKLTNVFDVNSPVDLDNLSEEAGEKYGTLSRSISQPDFMLNLHEDFIDDNVIQRPGRLFEKPLGYP